MSLMYSSLKQNFQWSLKSVAELLQIYQQGYVGKVGFSSKMQ